MNPNISGGVLLPGGKSELNQDGSGTQTTSKPILVSPTAGFVIKTSSLQSNSKQKLFINVCFHDAVCMPQKVTKLDANGNEVEGLNVPCSIGPVRSCTDREDNSCLVIDTIICPSIRLEIAKNETGLSYREFICQVLIQCVEQKYQKEYGRLDRKYKLPRLSYFGYIDPETGRTTRNKASNHSEICKQIVKDFKAPPTIEEVDDAPVGSVDSTSISSKKSSKLSTNAHETPSEDTDPATPLPNISFDISLILSTKEKITVQELINRVDSISEGLKRKGEILPNIAQYACEVGGMCQSSRRNATFPLLLDSPHIKDDLIVSDVVIQAVIPSALSRTRVDVTSYGFYINMNIGVGSRTSFKMVECILPFYILPQTAVCQMDEKTSLMKISARLSSERTDHVIDVGSQPWLLVHALSSDEKHSCSLVESSIKKKMYSNDHHDEDGNSDDPYQILDTVRSNCEDSNKLDGSLNLPEDEFHSKDVISQHILQQQQKEMQEKQKKAEETDCNSSIEHVSVEDFKPGGKYFNEGNTKDGYIDRSSSKASKNVYQNIRKGMKERLEQSNDDTFTNSLWLRIF